MADVVWSDPAINDIRGIISYIEQFDPDAAEQIGRQLFTLGDSLVTFPHRGRPAANGTRELVLVPPYVLSYHVTGEAVTILEVRHGRRQPR